MAFVVNLGGEGEVPGALNQQEGPHLDRGRPLARDHARTFGEEIDADAPFLLCPNDALALPDGCADAVVSNGVPIGKTGLRRSGIVPSEIDRILRPGGTWTHDGVPQYRKA